MGELYMGAVAPEVYIMQVAQGDSGVDLTTVSAATFQVFKPGGTQVTWTAAISGATATGLTLTHSFAASPPGDVDVPGDYYIYARLTVPGGIITTQRVLKSVRALYGVVR